MQSNAYCMDQAWQECFQNIFVAAYSQLAKLNRKLFAVIALRKLLDLLELGVHCGHSSPSAMARSHHGTRDCTHCKEGMKHLLSFTESEEKKAGRVRHRGQDHRN